MADNQELATAQGILARPKLPYEDPILNPNYVNKDDPNFQSQGLVGYKDKYGRIGVNQGNRDTSQVLRAPSFMDKAVPRNAPAIPPPADPGPTNPQDTINAGDSIHPEPAPTPQQNLFQMGELGALLGIGYMANGVYSMATDNLANTGMLSGVSNAIDAWGYNNIPGMNFAGVDGVGVNAGQTTLTNSIGYGMFGSFTAGLLGLSSDNFIKDTLAGAVGGVAGGALGGLAAGTAAGQAIGSTIGMALGPVGAFIGGFAMTALVSAFGPRPSDQLAGGLYDMNEGRITNSWTFQGNKYSSNNNKARDTFFGYVGTLSAQLKNTFGGTNNIKNIRLDLGRHTGVALNFNVGLGDEDTGHDVGGGKEALEAVGKEILKTSTYDNADIAYVQGTLDWNKTDFGTAAEAYTFAKDFRRVAGVFLSGELNVDTDYNQGMQIIDTWETRANNLFKDDPERLAMIAQAAGNARSKVNAKNYS